jgi:hypothetical protein
LNVQLVKAPSVSIEPVSNAKPLERQEPVVVRSQDARGAVTLTLNRPHAFNALSEAMLAALQNELDAIGEDESARVVVLAAEGKAFCAGHDLKEMRGKPSLDYYERLFRQCSEMMLGIQRLPLPVIARVQGSRPRPVASWWQCAISPWQQAPQSLPSAASIWVFFVPRRASRSRETFCARQPSRCL